MISRVLLLLLVAALACAMVNVRTGQGGHGQPGAMALGDRRFEFSVLTAVKERHATEPSHYWKLERRYVAALKREGRLGAEVRRLRGEARAQRRARTLQAVGSGPGYAIRLASSAFGVSENEMRTVADCETGGTFSPTAYNGSSGAAGLFQFLRGTWESQGLTGFSVYDAVANALATARIVAREGWAQWSCRP